MAIFNSFLYVYQTYAILCVIFPHERDEAIGIPPATNGSSHFFRSKPTSEYIKYMVFGHVSCKLGMSLKNTHEKGVNSTQYGKLCFVFLGEDGIARLRVENKDVKVLQKWDMKSVISCIFLGICLYFFKHHPHEFCWPLLARMLGAAHAPSNMTIYVATCHSWVNMQGPKSSKMKPEGVFFGAGKNYQWEFIIWCFDDSFLIIYEIFMTCVSWWVISIMFYFP